MNQERKAVIAAAVKPILQKYGVKGSLKVEHYTGITLTLSGGAIDFAGDLKLAHGRQQLVVEAEHARRQYNFDINQYWYHEHFQPGSKAMRFLQEIIPAMKAADWYDRSDARIDYFDTAYYFNIKVGRWDKPYIVAGKVNHTSGLDEEDPDGPCLCDRGNCPECGGGYRHHPDCRLA